MISHLFFLICQTKIQLAFLFFKSATSPTCVCVCVWKSWIYGKLIGTTTIEQGVFWGYPRNSEKSLDKHTCQQRILTQCPAKLQCAFSRIWWKVMTGRHPQNLTGQLDLEISPLLFSMAITWGSSITLGFTYHAWLKGDTTAIKDHRKLAMGISSDPNIPKLQYLH